VQSVLKKGAIKMSKLPPGWEKYQQALPSTGLPLAVQLYTVEEMLLKDLRGTLKLVKEAGYEGVEFAGGLRYVAQDVKYALDEAGLQIVGWHTPWDCLLPEHIHATITYNKVLGNQYIIVPWRPDEVLATKDSCLQFAHELTWIAGVLGKYDMVIGYHNHAMEFKPISDTQELPWDIIAQNTPSNVIMQNDIGNGMAGGGDMIALLKKYPGRAVTVHMKPFSEEGNGTFFDTPNCHIDWDEYFKICHEVAGTRWYIIEYQDNVLFPSDPIGAMAASAKWFRGREGK